jgi:hypothetical protein
LKGKDPLEAFGKILEIFMKLGITDVAKVLTWKEDEKGKYIDYIKKDITLESKRLNGRTVYPTLSHPFGVQYWIRTNTRYLKDRPDIFTKSLEKLFDEIISSGISIFFKLMKSDEFKEKYVNEGHGTCLDKNMSESGEIEVIVENFSKPKGAKIFAGFLLNFLQTIVHEFGHAYALMNNFFYTGKDRSMNTEMAVLFENKYRARTEELARLRYSHLDPWIYHKQYWSQFYRWRKIKGKKWNYYPPDTDIKKWLE